MLPPLFACLDTVVCRKAIGNEEFRWSDITLCAVHWLVEHLWSKKKSTFQLMMWIKSEIEIRIFFAEVFFLWCPYVLLIMHIKSCIILHFII